MKLKIGDKMNIFILDTDPEKAAQMANDKHVVKMPTESMQMICTIMDLYGFSGPMKPVMLNHPCTVWARQSGPNFQWLVNHCLALCEEYTVRYGRVHKVETYLEEYKEEIADTYAKLLSNNNKLTPFAQAMPESCKDDNIIKAYQQYYLQHKWSFSTWKTTPPEWWPVKHYETMYNKKINAFNKNHNANLKRIGE
tara:strand:+ start:5583 stop:6167 length:585 start_codon:yes stop_codon:yes gene_type:complete